MRTDATEDAQKDASVVVSEATLLLIAQTRLEHLSRATTPSARNNQGRRRRRRVTGA